MQEGYGSSYVCLSVTMSTYLICVTLKASCYRVLYSVLLCGFAENVSFKSSGIFANHHCLPCSLTSSGDLDG